MDEGQTQSEEDHLKSFTKLDLYSSQTRDDKKPGPTEDPVSRTNLSLDGLNPDFGLTEAARARIAAMPDHKTIPQAEDLVPTPRQERELATLEILTAPDSGQAIEALKVNWPDRSNDKPINQEVTVVLPAYLADPTDGPAHETVRQLAMQMPDRPLLAISQPKLTRDQRQALDQRGDLGPTAGAILGAIQAQGITDVNLVGRSMGAWTASTMAAMAHDYGITVHEAVLIESANAGVSGKDIAKGFLREIAKKYPDLYHAQDPQMRHAARMDRSTLAKSAWEATQFIKPLLRGRARDTVVRYPKGMAGGTLEGELDVALTHQDHLAVTLVNGGIDPISTNAANDAVANHLNAEHGPDSKGFNRVTRIIHPGAPHSNLENAKDTATIVRQRLELSDHPAT